PPKGLSRLFGSKCRPEGEGRPVLHRAINAYLETLARGGNASRFRSFVRRHRKLLRSHNACWEGVGHAMVLLKWYRRATAWLSDWQSRSGLQPWMLINLVVSFRCLSKDQQSASVSHVALSMPQDSSWYAHHLWLALDEAVEGDIDRAAS